MLWVYFHFRYSNGPRLDRKPDCVSRIQIRVLTTGCRGKNWLHWTEFVMGNINTTGQSITQHIIYIKIVYFVRATFFRPYKVILRPSKKTDPRVVYVSLHCGIPNAYKFLLEKGKTCKTCKALLAPYNAAPHNRYQPHPAEPAQHTTRSNTRSLFSWRWA